jgi:hypothetical protein
MARTRRTTRKSIGRLPVGQLAPQNVPQPQEFQPDIPQKASPEEEPFEIELVDEDGHQRNGVGGEVLQLEPIILQQREEEGGQRWHQPSQGVRRKEDKVP